jgi:hypothetical protein
MRILQRIRGAVEVLKYMSERAREAVVHRICPPLGNETAFIYSRLAIIPSDHG